MLGCVGERDDDYWVLTIRRLHQMSGLFSHTALKNEGSLPIEKAFSQNLFQKRSETHALACAHAHVHCVAGCCRIFQRLEVCNVAGRCRVLHGVAVCSNLLQCVVVCAITTWQ
mmetsp:Transcript_93387/g.150751  ORF Transcript_93387/g.150751 Transcript_93387/m.150751 type:complete len:113 (-) Transcript_93387:241-579(-)